MEVLDKIKEILGMNEVVTPEVKTEVKTDSPEVKTETVLNTDGTDQNPTSTDENKLTDPQAQIDELKSKVDDLNSRLTILEGQMMTAQKKEEQLSKIVEVLKDQPSGEPITKKETNYEEKKNDVISKQAERLAKIANINNK